MSNKGYSLGLLLAGCLAAGAAQAQGGQYAKAQLAIADVDGGFSDGLAVVGTYGMELPQLLPNFSVEGEFSTTISEADKSVFGNKLEYSYYTLGAYGVYTHPINQRVSIYGRAGLLYVDSTVDIYHPVTGKTSESDSDLELGLGAGTNIALGQNFDFTAGVNIINEDVNHISAGVQLRF